MRYYRASPEARTQLPGNPLATGTDRMTADAAKTSRKTAKPGAYFGIPLAVCVVVLLSLGLLFPGNRVAAAFYMSGTIFPKLIVTCATLIIFALLSGATAKLVLYNRR